jgi:4-amino-4-deoxy-L-arabinose transferase-like glycosyltransferase
MTPAFRVTRDMTAWILLGIGLLAFGLRWAAVAFHPQAGHYMHHDSYFYLDNARSILATGMPAENDAPIGFSYILCVFLKAGCDVHSIAYFLQPLVGAIDCLLLYFLCRQFGHPVAGLIAAAFAAIHPTLVNSSSQILTEPWATLFVLSSLLAAGTKKNSMVLLAGLLMGIASIIRAPSLAAFLGLPLWWMVRHGMQGVRRAAPFLLAGALPIIAVSVHLSVAHHRTVFLTLQSREASSVQSVPSGFVELEPEQEQERGGYFQYAARHPVRFVEERFFSFLNFTSPWPLDDNRSLWRKLFVTICDGSILLAAIWAAVALWKRQGPNDWFVFLWVPCCVCLFYTAFFSIPRYRVTSLPLLITFAALVLVPSRGPKGSLAAA